jgi:2-polyprenyl-3-methyl-5-hydroxy-6-metoxy-1,4-benzoquinol methylase
MSKPLPKLLAEYEMDKNIDRVCIEQKTEGQAWKEWANQKANLEGVPFFRRGVWRALQALGFKRYSWDLQFKAGVWSTDHYSPHLLHQVALLSRGGNILEFGCGEGDLPKLLPPDSYANYLGIDISEVAITRAQAKNPRCIFWACDMNRWKGSFPATLILLQECLYYIKHTQAEAFLKRCRTILEPGGSILVVDHDRTKHAKTLDICRRVCRVKSENVIKGRTFLILG